MKKKNAPSNLGPKQFRPFLARMLKGGGMDAALLILEAEKEFKDQMVEGDLEPVYSADGKRIQFTHSWMPRLYDFRKAMIDAGLMFASKHFPARQGKTRNWWQLTPKGLEPEHANGY